VSAREETPVHRAAGAPQLLPEVLDERADGSCLEQDWRVPAQLDCWPGHFPEQSILPGVVQVDWVMRTIEAWTGRFPRLARIEALKFKRLVLPEERLTLRLERAAGGAVFRFRLGIGEEIVSSGRIALDETPGGGR
jgi:3-hydroxymyristoyl/3-hydroxydecanoyl-(acyl carrier protein) dehydratase